MSHKYDVIMKYYEFINELFKKWNVNEDCQQIIWQSLLEYDQRKLIALDAKKELKYWLVRFIKNNWFSSTSKYYYTYKKYYEYIEDPIVDDEDDWGEE